MGLPGSVFTAPLMPDTPLLLSSSPPDLRLPAEARIQKGYQRLSSSQARGSEAAAGGQYTGVLGQLMEKGQLSLDLIKANVTELMAGGVDTVCVCVFVLPWCIFVHIDLFHVTSRAVVLQTAVPLQFALFELGRNPDVQERVRQQVRASWAQAGGDSVKALQGAPLLKGTIKEILR